MRSCKLDFTLVPLFTMPPFISLPCHRTRHVLTSCYPPLPCSYDPLVMVKPKKNHDKLLLEIHEAVQEGSSITAAVDELARKKRRSSQKWKDKQIKRYYRMRHPPKRDHSLGQRNLSDLQEAQLVGVLEGLSYAGNSQNFKEIRSLIYQLFPEKQSLAFSRIWYPSIVYAISY